MRRALTLGSGLVGLLGLLSACPQFPDDPSRRDGGSSVEDGPDMSGPIRPRSCATEVTFQGDASARSVALAGEFNGWDEASTPLEREQGVWRAELELEPGEYAYKFVVDGEYEGAPSAEVATKWSGGFENRSLIVEDCAVPAWEVVESGVSASGVLEVRLQFVPAQSGAAIDPESVRVTVAGEPVEPKINAGSGLVTITYQAAAHGKYSVRAWAEDSEGRATQQSPLWLPLWHEEQAFVWQDSTMYLIFTDRFLDTDGDMPQSPIGEVNPIAGYLGGDFNGITTKIKEGYFERLGVNLLWLSPVYENTEQSWAGGDGVNRFTGYHGYWPIDPLKTESRYGDAEMGSDERLKELIEAAHEHGIRVLFDLVHNHVHEEHSYCKEHPSWCEVTCTCGSPGCAWEGPDGKPLTCQFASYLPDLNYRNHDILLRQIEDTLKLVERYDVDGVRVDAAKHMDHIIMRRLRQRLDALEAQGAAPFYAVGETYTGGDGYELIMRYVSDHELHGQFDFPLLYPIREVFGKEGSFRALEEAVRRSETAYGEAYTWMSPFLGNHDIPRFATESLGNDWDPWSSSLDVMAQGPASSIEDAQWNLINRMSLGFAFLLTQPGIPLVYYGDEIGLAGSGDPDNRRMMDWEWNAAQRELFERVAALGRARQDQEPLRRGARRELYVDDTLYVYARHQGPGEVVIVAMNKGPSRQEAIAIPPDLGLDGVTLRGLVGERSVRVEAQTLQLGLDPWEYVLLAP